ncbi:MAG: prephenate dehydratase domain-containing protein [Acidobacteriota bacterium]
MTRVAIQGIKGSYSEEAAIRLLGDAIDLVECPSFEAAFREAETNGMLAVIPVRNTIAGRIESTSLLLAKSNFAVRDEIVLGIDHVLAGATNTEFAAVRTVTSHPEALKQCSGFLAENPQISTAFGSDTASSIRDVAAANGRDNAAIGSRRAAEMYGARVLRENVANAIDNRTTFYLIGK